MRIYQFITALLPLCAAAMEIESVKFASEGDLNGWAVSPSNAAIISDGALKVTNPVRSENSRAEIVKSLPLGKVAGGGSGRPSKCRRTSPRPSPSGAGKSFSSKAE